jgi:hypothetical protein
LRFYGHNPVPFYPDIDAVAAVRKVGAAKNQVHLSASASVSARGDKWERVKALRVRSVDVRQIQRSKLRFGYDGAFQVARESPGQSRD